MRAFGHLVFFVLFILFPLALVVGGIGSCMRYMPEYEVWQQGMAGKAALTRAEQDRQIAIAEANAELEAARLKAKAEVARAEGAAEANKIMSASLGGPIATSVGVGSRCLRPTRARTFSARLSTCPPTRTCR